MKQRGIVEKKDEITIAHNTTTQNCGKKHNNNPINNNIMNKIFFLFTITLTVFISCNKQNNEQFATIRGKAVGDIKKVSFDWFKENSADVSPKKHIAKVDSLGSFALKIPIQQLSEGSIIAQGNRYSAILLPCDDLDIFISKDSISFAGKGAEKNNFIYSLYEKEKCSMSEIMMSWYTENHAFDEFYTMIDDYKATRNAALDKFQTQHKLQKEFLDYFDIETKLDCISLYLRARISYSRKNKIPIDSLEIPTKFVKNYKLNELVNDKYLIYKGYLDILNSIIRKRIPEIMKSDSLLKYEDVQLSLIMDSLSGKTRENYLLKDIYYSLSLFDNYDSLFVAAFDSIKQDKNCIATFNTEIAKFNKKRAMLGVPFNKELLATELYDTTETKLTMADVLKKSKGRVVYIDVWSLGCGPCRIAMPLSHKLKEKLKQYPIDFVYLTVDDFDDKLWEEVFKVSLTKHNHYRFAKGFKSKMHEIFNIIAVPTYLLIDKQGNLVSYKAERPFNRKFQANTKLEKKLIELAEK